MDIIYKQGDLLECQEKWIVHGCNAQGVMGSGVAKAIKEKYPSAFRAYRAAEEVRGLTLGDLSWAEQVDGKIVFNAITQEFYGRAGKCYVDYNAIRWMVEGLNHLASEWGVVGVHVAMPKIGAGLGGGDWNYIEIIIEECSHNFQPVVYTL